MNQEKFATYSLSEKVHLVLEDGEEISSRIFLYFQIKLYVIYDFFVEVWYIPHSNKIEKVSIVDTDEILNSYKHDFDISELLQ